MKTKLILTTAGAIAIAGCAGMQKSDAEYRAEAAQISKRDFQTRGIANVERLNQDEAQKLCNQYENHPPKEVAAKIEQAQLASIKYPADGKYLGQWKAGQALSQSGRGGTWSDKAGVPNGGNCYNCHQMSPGESSYGTLGPSLLNFGKIRGYNDAMAKYAYGKIYNSQAFNACSNMPRFGYHGTLTEQQIRDIVAYLMDPNSPVNK
jgi:sulfur-oxidizing protein SoxX